MANDNNGDDGDWGDDGLEFPRGHSSFNDSGGEYLPDEHLEIFGNVKTHEAVFEMREKTFARSQTTRVNTGRWDPDTASVEETFKSGPICLNTLAKMGVFGHQHNFLVDCATFLKKKYPDNWEEALKWINVNVLRPAGDADKLRDIVRTCKDKNYNPRCQEEPMVSFCHSRACRLEKYGVGNAGPENGRNFALTVVNTYPTTYFVGDDDNRMRLNASELLKIDKFREKCLEHRHTMPLNISQKEWVNLLVGLIEEAGTIEPSKLYRKHVEQLEALEKYIAAHVPNMVRAKGQEFLSGQVGDYVRVRMKEERFHFKWDKLRYWLERGLSMRLTEIAKMREYIDTQADAHGRTDMRGWFRCSYSLRFDVFDEDMVHHWLHPDEPDKED